MEENIHTKTSKIYYSMGEVSEMFDVNPSLIRFWEKKFDIIKPHKNKKGNRLFTPEDVDNLKIIYHLVKEKGMTLAGAQLRMKENRTGMGRDMEIIERLQKVKAMLMEIRQELSDENDDDPNSTILGRMSVETTQVLESKTEVVEPTRSVATEIVAPVVPVAAAVVVTEEFFEHVDSAVDEADENDEPVEETFVPFIQQTLF